MRIFLVGLIAALLTVTAYAQGIGGMSKGGGRHRESNEQKADDAQKKKKAAESEKAYKSAIESLPDQKYDPWKNMR
jgi:hypothetical protein